MEIPRDFYKERSREVVRVLENRVQGGHYFFSLLRGDTNIVVQASQREMPKYIEGLQILQNQCVQQIDFDIDAPKWCYLVKVKDGWRVSQRSRQFEKPVTCSPWATSVYQRDIEYLEYPGLELRHARWKGQKVDVYLAWIDDDIQFIDRAMTAYRRLQGKNLTYEVLAHVIDDFGNIIGIMTERMRGRALKLEDRKLVEDAMETLNGMGLVYEKPDLSNFLITSNNEVRLTQVYNVFPLHKDPSQAERAIRKNRSDLNAHIFCYLEENRGVSFAPHQFSWEVLILVPLSNPERLLRGSQEWVCFKGTAKNMAENPILFKVEKARGQKRKTPELGESREDEENYRWGPIRAPSQVILPPESPPPFMSPLPPLNEFGDLPLTPKRRRGNPASSPSTTVVSLSGRSSPMFIWMEPWVNSPSESRFKLVDE